MSALPDPGALDQRITLQARSVTTDAFGQDTITWVDIATVWAQCQAVRGREFFAAAQVQQEQTVKVRIRYRTGISTLTRLLWQGRAHDITGVVPVGRKEMLELMCLQGVKDGR
jgi:SPP1 family predicted phage head-tail adaptor